MGSESTECQSVDSPTVESRQPDQPDLSSVTICSEIVTLERSSEEIVTLENNDSRGVSRPNSR